MFDAHQLTWTLTAHPYLASHKDELNRIRAIILHQLYVRETTVAEMPAVCRLLFFLLAKWDESPTLLQLGPKIRSLRECFDRRQKEFSHRYPPPPTGTKKEEGKTPKASKPAKRAPRVPLEAGDAMQRFKDLLRQLTDAKDDTILAQKIQELIQIRRYLPPEIRDPFNKTLAECLVSVFECRQSFAHLAQLCETDLPKADRAEMVACTFASRKWTPEELVQWVRVLSSARDLVPANFEAVIESDLIACSRQLSPEVISQLVQSKFLSSEKYVAILEEYLSAIRVARSKSNHEDPLIPQVKELCELQKKLLKQSKAVAGHNAACDLLLFDVEQHSDKMLRYVIAV